MKLLSCAGELNHHGKIVCDELYRKLGSDFIRVTTTPVDQSRIDLGYSDYSNSVGYNKTMIAPTSREIEEIVSWCDVMDYGSAPEEFLHAAVRQKKTVFIRLERLFKEGYWKLLSPRVLMRYYRKYVQYRNNKHVYYLCIGAYVASDLKRIGVRNERILQWAYCPELQDLDDTAFRNPVDEIQIIWVGRLIGWKHPETAVMIANELRNKNCRFHMNMVGMGKSAPIIEKLINDMRLGQQVTLLGSKEASEVRALMVDADVLLATSDQNEGWGVVVNEGMSSGCLVVASREMGSVPVLIDDGKNGFVIDRDDVEATAERIMEAWSSGQLPTLKRQAYRTIREFFSPSCYADAFVSISEGAIANTLNENDTSRRLGKRIPC